MQKITFQFRTKDLALGFIEGLMFVNDSSLTFVSCDCLLKAPYPYRVVVEDNDSDGPDLVRNIDLGEVPVKVSANRLCDQFGDAGIWNEHPDYPRSDWQAEVSAGDELCGYWEYVEKRVEQDTDDNNQAALSEIIQQIVPVEINDLSGALLEVLKAGGECFGQHNLLSTATDAERRAALDRFFDWWNYRVVPLLNEFEDQD